MATDIFSSFDDHNKTFFNMWTLTWMTCLIILLLPLKTLSTKNSTKKMINMSLYSIVMELVLRSPMKSLLGSLSMMTSIILTVSLLNLLGLTPYTFSLTSHLSINLSVALTLWTTVTLMSFTYSTSDFMAHLQPPGSPALLNPFLCVVELISLLVRPFTLAVRLTANLSTGHILMALLGTGMVNSSLPMAFILLMIGSMYFLFEMAVCLIQAYIFTLLPTLYAEEHPNNISYL